MKSNTPTSIIDRPTFQKMVRRWLDVNERKQVYLARHTGFLECVVTTFFQGKKVSPRFLVKVAELTKIPYKVECEECSSVIMPVQTGK